MAEAQDHPTMPFPGMDPYLEHPVLWEEFHTRLVVEIAKQLSPKLLPRYITSVEHRVYIEVPEHQRKPDVWVQRSPEQNGGIAVATDSSVATAVVLEVPELEIKERSLEILDRYQEMKVVTVLEAISPSNKRAGPGRDAYVTKQQSTLASDSHLVEIDLLRRGKHVVAVPESELPQPRPFDYLIGVNRWPYRRRFELYPQQLRERLPRFFIPLADEDPDVVLDLQQAVKQAYQDAGFMLRVKYNEPCVPPLSTEDQAWADECWAAYQRARTDLFPTS